MSSELRPATDEERAASVALAERAVAEREVRLRVRAQTLEAERFGVEGRTRVLVKTLERLLSEGAQGAAEALVGLPRLGPPPAEGPQRRGLAAREAAVELRLTEVSAWAESLNHLEVLLRYAQRQLAASIVEAKAVADRKAAMTPPRASAPPSDERRQRPRARLDAKLTLNSEDNFFRGFAQDLSDGGLFVATFDTLPVGEAVTVCFALPSGMRIEAEAIVRWVREPQPDSPEVWPGMGVEFKVLDAEVEWEIRQYMDLREPLFFVD